MQLYSPIIIKLALGILCLILQINLLGKGNLAPTSALDQVQNYVLGGIIGGVIYNDSISVLQFFLVLIIWTMLVLIVKFAKEHNRYIRFVIDGRPISLVEWGKLNIRNCLKVGMSANELMFKLRMQGVYEIKQVKRAILEQNGQLTIIKFGEDNIIYPIIVDGQVDFDALSLINHDELWLHNQLKIQKQHNVRKIYLAEYVNNQLVIHNYD
ncbi:DUF421 domain-containing protein [Periweissella ghanensis]|uniref:DUF421 domain-containing protein n=1 Tax=Periweissella ghanensis TaxID=467997 RepID=A0ABN8BQJ7_9LACO|nr:DUF421 domain-containing protein [Periweissella ghanensis]MCM0601883.1 DUF421 domain-containing protein [Periweissella ghanensis]CAH0418869.1 hypothetical protein WGH24286_01312 [Periweissella ghanensis]